MTKYLLLLTIGPVKSFIQESRKAQDLFASSSLLSSLCKTAILESEKLLANNSFSLITPTISNEKLKKEIAPSIPNRFLAFVKGDEKELTSIIDTVKQNVIEDFSKIEKYTLSKSAKKQLENHLDIRWVLSPHTNYDIEAYLNVNRQLAAIKNYNNIKQTNEIGRKCIVDGKNNVKFYRLDNNETLGIRKDNLYKKLYQNKDEVKIIGTDDESYLKIWHLQKGEGISAVTLKKRLFNNKPHSLPSTVGIALMHVFDRLKEDEDFITFKKKVQGDENNKVTKYFTHSNDQLFYRDNIESLFFREFDRKEAITKIDVCAKEHDKWSKKLNKIPLSKYYALIRFDGDKLGDWFSGKFKSENVPLLKYHQQLSKNIIAFADKMRKEIAAPLGKVIYAGGEDFMAMINLHYLKESVNLINRNFKELLSDKMQDLLKEEKEFTLSMGITIAHYKEPLQLVLDKTAKMEKLAKDTDRNKFALKISKHSGGQLQTSLPWKDNSLDKIYTIVDLIIDKKISSAFLLKIYNYCFELDFNSKAKNIVESKMKLFINRSINNKAKIFDEVYDILIHFIEHAKDLKEFAELLLIIDFIQRHEYKKETYEN